jgi:hypothetical protein
MPSNPTTLAELVSALEADARGVRDDAACWAMTIGEYAAKLRDRADLMERAAKVLRAVDATVKYGEAHAKWTPPCVPTLEINAAIASALGGGEVLAHVHEFRYSHTEQRPLGVGTNFEMVDVAICPGCAEVRRGVQHSEIEQLRAAITTTLASAPCAHLADDHGHQRCGALPTQHDGRRHPYTRPRMLDALAVAIEA